jgi:hypothetical protein
MNNIAINLVYEDAVSHAVLVKLLGRYGNRYLMGRFFHANGNGWIKSRIQGLNRAAKGMPYLVLTDLDRDECAPLLIRSWLNDSPKHPNLLFRVAVREVEAWLLASREEMGQYLRVSSTRIPRQVDEIPDPKLELINLARRSRREEIRRNIPPRESSTAKIGPGYNSHLVEFIGHYWNPDEARKHSPSLDDAISALDSFRPVFERNNSKR